jgi:hypothetical protein
VDSSGNSFLVSRSTKLLKFSDSGVIQWEQYYNNNTLQAIPINGSELYLGGALQSGITSFGAIDLLSSPSVNTAFLIICDLTSSSGYLILTINPDYSVTIGGICTSESNPPVVATSGQDNYYNPSERKFYLNYQYTLSSGIRYISDYFKYKLD